MDETRNQPGIIDAADRVARELIRTPAFKERVRLLLNALDPGSAPGLIRTLMWSDPDFFLSLIGALPGLINICIHGGKELLEQLGGVPPAMLSGLVAEFIGRLDGEALGALATRGAELSLSLEGPAGAPLRESWSAFLERAGGGLATEGGRGGGRALIALLPLLRGWIARMAAEAAAEGTAARRLISGLAEAVRANPDFIDHVYGPLAEAFRGAAGGSTK